MMRVELAGISLRKYILLVELKIGGSLPSCPSYRAAQKER
jgi:hypothetical protein